MHQDKHVEQKYLFESETTHKWGARNVRRLLPTLARRLLSLPYRFYKHCEREAEDRLTVKIGEVAARALLTAFDARCRGA